ncbi:FtsW/RodA/SpoVE family cell cycle protein [Paenibacillus sp. MMS20-IR301]|uniref:FtsW/RodA/SpoVE family cell cycle protein n=1 Tax=Paenibacillus sp. MMS20-IR301 TaxID=2895946 RepID=UPI0028E267F9|nr:FtsW/RodA/SpoVE family cell cycle protein [Paenibacillus sp. MMS20-IR301]WNS42614.1 FtsW/RodA/SpoVE family cell cycle protein [Paenibacillus sp. MMS20-IR301]
MLQRIRRIDGSIVLILFMLMGVSILSIYSVTHGRGELDGTHIKMIIYYGLGFIAFMLLALFDYRLIVRYGLYIYILGIGILLLVSLIGKVKNGAQGWIGIGDLSIQPAELFKLILIIFLTTVLVRKNRNPLRFWRDVLPLGLIALMPFALVIIQNDLGNALSYIVILVGLLWIGNVRFSHALIGLIVAGGAVLGFILCYINYHEQTVDFIEQTLGRDHFVRRFDPWLVPDLASSDASYQTRNAKTAIASGGLGGEGYLQGGTVQSDRVPYLYSESIFVQIGEEFGFLGSAAVLMLFFILIHRLILIALDCRDRGGPFLIVGIVAMLLYQILENIGAMIGLMPLTGITLPFISYGGTSLLINMACMGIAMSVRLYGQDVDDGLPLPSGGNKGEAALFKL